MAAATPRLLGLSLFYPSFSRRTPGPRDHGALGGSQKGIKPPRFPQRGACCSFKRAQASCRWKARCVEVRFVAAAPPWLLGPRFRGGGGGAPRGGGGRAARGGARGPPATSGGPA